MTVLEAALAYAAHGWRVVPLHGPGRRVPKAGKAPWLARWQDNATTDPDVIRGWRQERPDSNVGVATGPGSGLAVLDVDPRAGGADSLRQLQAGGRLPRALTAVTGSGGLHLLYRHPGVRSSAPPTGSGPGSTSKQTAARSSPPPHSTRRPASRTAGRATGAATSSCGPRR